MERLSKTLICRALEARAPHADKPRVSERKLEANRKNALKSTGPRTVSGKTKSAANPYKHGFYANPLFLNAEQWEKEHLDYEAVANGFGQHYPAVAYVEEFMVEKIATEALRLRRQIRYEQKMMTWPSPFEERASSNLLRYQTSTNRQIF